MTIQSLYHKISDFSGATLFELAHLCGQRVPKEGVLYTKGWVGHLIELLLGAQAGSRPLPDFPELGLELKTIPMVQQKVKESTFISTFPLEAVLESHDFYASPVYRKLKKVLWVPYEAPQGSQALGDCRLGAAVLWELQGDDLAVVQQDWEDIMERAVLQGPASLNAAWGQYLQVRPKAANRRVTVESWDVDGAACRAGPRGFYLRPAFTQRILNCDAKSP